MIAHDSSIFMIAVTVPSCILHLGIQFNKNKTLMRCYLKLLQDKITRSYGNFFLNSYILTQKKIFFKVSLLMKWRVTDRFSYL